MSIIYKIHNTIFKISQSSSLPTSTCTRSTSTCRYRQQHVSLLYNYYLKSTRPSSQKFTSSSLQLSYCASTRSTTRARSIHWNSNSNHPQDDTIISHTHTHHSVHKCPFSTISTAGSINTTSSKYLQDDMNILRKEQHQHQPHINPTSEPKSSSSMSSQSIRLSKLISQGQNMQMSRRSAEALISIGSVTVAGKIITNPSHKIDYKEAKGTIKVAGRHLKLLFDNDQNNNNNNQNSNTKNNNNTHETNVDDNQEKNITITKPKTRIWLANKLRGELVAEHDPMGRASLIERLSRGGVGKPTRKQKATGMKAIHLKPIGRLDMMTEGLVLVTNDGAYAREMSLPSNQIQRTYRVRVHGNITHSKLKALRSGMEIKGVFYKGMKVNLELKNGRQGSSKGGNTNSWLTITCIEGKNRMVRKTLDHLGLQVTRLIRTSFGDYDLNTIPPGLAIESPVKSLESQKKQGPLLLKKGMSNKTRTQTGYNKDDNADSGVPTPVQWIRHA